MKTIFSQFLFSFNILTSYIFIIFVYNCSALQNVLSAICYTCHYSRYHKKLWNPNAENSHLTNVYLKLLSVWYWFVIALINWCLKRVNEGYWTGAVQTEVFIPCVIMYSMARPIYLLFIRYRPNYLCGLGWWRL